MFSNYFKFKEEIIKKNGEKANHIFLYINNLLYDPSLIYQSDFGTKTIIKLFNSVDIHVHGAPSLMIHWLTRCGDNKCVHKYPY